MKRISIALFFVFFFSLLAGLAGCVPSDSTGQTPPEPPPIVEEKEKSSKVRFYDIPEGVEKYEKAEVYVGGVQLPVYGVKVNTSQTWSPNNYERTLSGAGLFELDGKAEVVVKLDSDAELGYASKLRPLSAKITPIADIENKTLRFTIKSAGEYVLEINGDKDDVIHLFVSDYEEEADKSGYTNVIYFGAGLHTAQNSSYIKSDNTVTVNSNTLVYLDDGAVVRAKFNANNARNIAIKGRGIIDGSVFDRNADGNHYTVTVPIDFNYCKNVVLEDFTVLDPAGWCVNFYFIDGAQINDIKIITSRSNGDGISLQSCKNITVDGCFVRTWDDSLVVKNYPEWSDRDNKYGSTENIVFKNCTLWTDLAQSMEVGYETVGQKLENVTFENITVLHALHQAAISMHNANNADIKDITFKDITIEDANGTSVDGLINGIIDIRNLFSNEWSVNHTTTPLGSISGVTIENVKVVSARKLTMTIGGCRDTRKGYESDHYVDGVTVNGISISNKLPTVDECKINKTGYLKNFEFRQDIEVTGARFLFSRTDEYLSDFGKDCKVQFIKGQ